MREMLRSEFSFDKLNCTLRVSLECGSCKEDYPDLSVMEKLRAREIIFPS